jgi:hypothetical protein
MFRSKFALFFIVVLVRQSFAAEESIPDLNSRASDGFLVKCYWFGDYYGASKVEGQGVVGAFGQALSPLCYTQVTTAKVIITEEVNERGEIRGVLRGGHWKSDVSGLHYLSKANQTIPAGANASSGQRLFPLSGPDAPSVGVWHDVSRKGTVAISFGTTALSFDLPYRGLTFGGHRGLEVRLGGSETKSQDVHIWNMDAEEEVEGLADVPTELRDEWGSPHGDVYGRWIMTRVCEHGKLKLITPRGDPRTAPNAPTADPCAVPAPRPVDGQNEYTFNCDSAGKLVINFKASITPASAINSVRDRVSFTIDPIAGSTLRWDASNPNGKAKIDGQGFLVATATFTGLPAKNDDFGLKTVQLLLDGKLCAKTFVEIFFPKFGINHPGGVVGDPNWFYYWQEGQVCGIAPTDEFDGTKSEKFIAYSRPWDDSNVRLCPPAAMTNQGPITYPGAAPWGSITGCGTGRGIKKVAEVLEHERKHIAIYKAYHARIEANPGIDGDRDHVPNANEPNDAGVRSDPVNSDTFNVATIMSHLDYKGYGDDEIRCRWSERNLTILYYPKKDWANPGCQSKQQYGPTR